MTKQEGIIKAQELLKKDELYIMLSKSKADMTLGVSIPFVGMVGEKNHLCF